MDHSSIPLAGVIGRPVAHSRSPRLHGHWLRRLGLRGHYVPLDVGPDDLAEVLRALPRMGFVGANVTIPHKTAALQAAHNVTDRAALIGAANTLTFRDGRITADNTDGLGFLAALRAGAPDWRPEAGAAAVLGAGGAARAVLAALVEAGVPRILLSNRSRGRAERLRTDFGARVEVVDWSRAASLFDDAVLAVNTTSLGMQGAAPMRVPLGGFHPGLTVMDLVYAPLETPFLAAARTAGATAVDGLGMLIHQAVPGFERWFGHRPPVDDETRRVLLGPPPPPR